LRTLAREIGTSHQLSSHYLQHWEKWQEKEWRRRAKELRGSAEAETRPWVIDDLLRKAEICERTAFQWMLDSAIRGAVKELEQKAKAGPLNKWHLKSWDWRLRQGLREHRRFLPG
jgi:hypothetical protein